MSEKKVSIPFPGTNVAYLLSTKWLFYYNPRKYLSVSYFDRDASILSFCLKQVSLLFFNLPTSQAVPLVHFFGNSKEVSGTWNDYLTAEPGLCSSVICMARGQRELGKQRALFA